MSSYTFQKISRERLDVVPDAHKTVNRENGVRVAQAREDRLLALRNRQNLRMDLIEQLMQLVHTTRSS